MYIYWCLSHFFEELNILFQKSFLLILLKFKIPIETIFGREAILEALESDKPLYFPVLELSNVRWENQISHLQKDKKHDC